MQWEVITQVFILTGIIIIGYIASKLNVYSQESVNGMSKLLANVANPALLIGSLQTQLSGEHLDRAWMMLGLSLVYHFGICLILLPLSRLFKMQDKMRRITIMLIGFGNVGFIGYPLAMSMYGDIGLLYSIPVSVGFQVAFWTVGSIVLSGEKRIQWKNLLSPGTLSSFYVMLCMAFPVLRLPDMALEMFNLTGQITVPLALILVGSMLASAELESVIKNKLSYIISFVKLIVIPLISYGILLLLGVDKIVATLFTVLMATPTGSLVPIVANLHNCEPEYAAGVTSLSTILFIGTIPVMLMLVL